MGQRLRQGAAVSVRGADKLVADALATTQRVVRQHSPVVVRADSAYYSAKVAKSVLDAGAELSVTVKMSPVVQQAINSIDDQAWTGIKYPQAIYDEDAGTWISEAEVAEVSFTAFSSKTQRSQHVNGRLIVRRIPEKNTKKLAAADQDPLFPVYRYHTVFTTIPKTVLDTVAADKTHRQHAIIEQVHAELKNGALAHMPSASFNANAAWLVTATMAHNLTRATATTIGGTLAKARSLSIRDKIISIPARIAHRARKLVLHLPTKWKWAHQFSRFWNATLSPPITAAST